MPIIALTLQDSPEAFHRAVVNAAANTGHTLCHPGIQQFLVEGSAGVLESTVAVEQRVCIRIFQNRFIKRVKNQLVVILVTNNIADDSPVTQIENRTQIELVDNWTFIPLELRYIGQPLFVGMPRPEFPVQTILCCCLRIRGLEQGGSAAARQQSNQQPSGLLVSPRWSTAGKVYRETAIVYLVLRYISHDKTNSPGAGVLARTLRQGYLYEEEK